MDNEKNIIKDGTDYPCDSCGRRGSQCACGDYVPTGPLQPGQAIWPADPPAVAGTVDFFGNVVPATTALAAERAAIAADIAKDAATAADLAFAAAARAAHLAELFHEPSAAYLHARADLLLDEALRAAELTEYHQRQAALARQAVEG